MLTYREIDVEYVPTAMAQAAAEETGVGIGMVDWQTYAALEDNGQLWIGGMDSGDMGIVGIAAYILGPDTKRLGESVAHSDCIYVQPAYRIQALTLVRWCCAQLAGIGIHRIYHHLPQGVVFGRALQRDGHAHLHNTYVLEVGDGRGSADSGGCADGRGPQ